jgi:2-dehydropantoate 2-reductase
MSVLRQGPSRVLRSQRYNPFCIQRKSMSTSIKPVHVIGTGNLGIFIAHSLRKSHPQVPITLIFYREGQVEKWRANDQSIQIITNDIVDRQTGFEFESAKDLDLRNERPISQLVVATKTFATKQAVESVKRRIDSSSSLLFVQNGMGNGMRALSMYVQVY